MGTVSLMRYYAATQLEPDAMGKGKCKMALTFIIR